MNEFLTSAPFALILMIIGFIFLIKGADAFVEGSSDIARRFHVPPMIIGMTIVAMGTSLPETAVSVTAAITGNNELAVSNAVGSNTFNLMIVIGVCAILAPMKVQIGTLKKDFPLSIICAIMLLGLGAWGMTLGHIDGILFILIFSAFLFYMVRSVKKTNSGSQEAAFEEGSPALAAQEVHSLSMPKSIFFIAAGAVVISLGSDWVVNGASTIAAKMGIGQTLIGLTVVAFGTSLPELVTSIVAAKKKEVDMAFGNVIGSNIFNILMVLGIASAISPITFIRENMIDIVILIVFSLIVWVMVWTEHQVNKKEGIVMVVLYAIYVVYICIR